MKVKDFNLTLYNDTYCMKNKFIFFSIEDDLKEIKDDLKEIKDELDDLSKNISSENAKEIKDSVSKLDKKIKSIYNSIEYSHIDIVENILDTKNDVLNQLNKKLLVYQNQEKNLINCLKKKITELIKAGKEFNPSEEGEGKEENDELLKCKKNIGYNEESIEIMQNIYRKIQTLQTNNKKDNLNTINNNLAQKYETPKDDPISFGIDEVYKGEYNVRKQDNFENIRDILIKDNTQKLIDEIIKLQVTRNPNIGHPTYKLVFDLFYIIELQINKKTSMIPTIHFNNLMVKVKDKLIQIINVCRQKYMSEIDQYINWDELRKIILQINSKKYEIINEDLKKELNRIMKKNDKVDKIFYGKTMIEKIIDWVQKK